MIWQSGALDFAGGTVVHINAAVAGLVGAYMVGKRIGYGKESMAPHSLTLTMVGASLLWVGWFGFNAGSALEANGFAALAFINTFGATAAAVLAWCVGEALMRGKASMLGAASGAVAGLVAITPAAGNVGIGGALVIGFIAGFACLWGVNGLKKMLGADDSLDVFGVHGVGGIVGALLTGVFNSPALGGPGYVADWVTATMVTAADYSIAAQVWVQAKAVLTTIVWSGVVSFVAYKIVDLTIGLRVAEEAGARRPGHLVPRRNCVQPVNGQPGAVTLTAPHFLLRESPLDIRPTSVGLFLPARRPQVAGCEAPCRGWVARWRLNAGPGAEVKRIPGGSKKSQARRSKNSALRPCDRFTMPDHARHRASIPHRRCSGCRGQRRAAVHPRGRHQGISRSEPARQGPGDQRP